MIEETEDLTRPYEIIIKILLKQKGHERQKTKELESKILDWFIKTGKPQKMATHFNIIKQTIRG